MECAICFDPIGVARTTLSCAHTFHLRCISAWFYQQNMGCELNPEDYTAGQTASSCPCCRTKPPSTLDDIPCEQMICFIDDNASHASSVTLDNPFAEDDELATEAAFNRAFARRPDTPPPPSVPRLDLTRLEVRWTRTGLTSWQRQVGDTIHEGEDGPAAAAPEVWDGARTPSPPPDSLVEQTTQAARTIQTAFRAYHAS
jgi:hypothetical protein